MIDCSEGGKTFKIHPELISLVDKYQGILLDAYGVFWGGNGIGLFSGCREAMEQIVREGKVVGILSNSTQPANKEILKLNTHGLILGTHFHFLITSGEIAKRIFLEQRLPFPTPKKKFYLFGEAHPRFTPPQMLFEGTVYNETKHLEEADFIYISIPHVDGKDQTDSSCFQENIKKILYSRLPMVCANPDRFAHEGNPPQAVVRQGTIAKLYEGFGGQVFYIGKPYEQTFSAAMNLFEQHGLHDPKNILMVGDTTETDILGAKNFGMASALVLKTGIAAETIQRVGLEKYLKTISPEETPDYFIESMANSV